MDLTIRLPSMIANPLLAPCADNIMKENGRDDIPICSYCGADMYIYISPHSGKEKWYCANTEYRCPRAQKQDNTMKTLINITKVDVNGKTTLLVESPLGMVIPTSNYSPVAAYAWLSQISEPPYYTLVLNIMHGYVTVLPGEKLILEIITP
jgi:hypothetical protein